MTDSYGWIRVLKMELQHSIVRIMNKPSNSGFLCHHTIGMGRIKEKSIQIIRIKNFINSIVI